MTKQNDEKVRDIFNLEEKLDALEENMKLKDVLYGCCECGMYTCECDDAVSEENICNPPSAAQPSFTSATLSEAPAPQHFPPPTGSGSYPPWTPQISQLFTNSKPLYYVQKKAMFQDE